MEQEEFERQYIEAESAMEKAIMDLAKTNEVSEYLADELFDAMEYIQERIAKEFGYDYWELRLSQ